MPPPVPDRFRLEQRLGRDGDVEEWLATDTSLDRPVLIRLIGPESSEERRTAFLTSVRTAAAVNHTHLAAVYTAGELTDGAYAVCEWTGALSVADRLDAGETIEPSEFLPNAAGLARALAALHDHGVVHGAIDPSALFYTVSHPAKLGAFGRPRRSLTPPEDVAALAAALEEAVTGARPGGPAPSEVVDGLPPQIDAALRRAQGGELTAGSLAEEIAAAPTPHAPEPEQPGRSRRLLAVATALVLLGTGLVALGRLFSVDRGAPVLFPPKQGPSTTLALPTTTTTVAIPAEDESPPLHALRVTSVNAFDPYGGGTENNAHLGNLVDGDVSTTWRTEHYFDPLPLIKPGVGLTFQVAGLPVELEIVGISTDVAYTLAWKEVPSSDPASWTTVARGRTQGGTLTVQLPPHPGGTWLFWMTDLATLGPSDHGAEIAEVRFRG